MTEYRPDDQQEEETEDFAQLFESTFKEPERLRPGQMIEAMVVKITPEWIFLDVGRKGEGYLDRKELADAEGNVSVQEGDRIHAYYLPGKGQEMHFTTRIGAGPVGHSQMMNAFKAGVPVEGAIAKEIKGGFEVRISGSLRAFCPFSQMGLRREDDRAAVIGQTFTFKITECGERNIVLSRKAMVELERKSQAAALRESLQEGMRVQGRVTSIQKFGAFLDIGGIEGLLPVSELAWSRVEKVEDKLAVGQTVEVVIKRIDWENNKISFSLKDALPDPWERAPELWPVGSYHFGTVSRLAPFGAFVTMGEGIDGLIHISKLGAGRRVGHPREVLKEGQSVEVRVEGVDTAAKKLSLSLAAVSRAQEEEAEALEVYRQRAESSSGGLGTLGDLLKGQPGSSDKDS
ncbi:MAG: 30S ribosomal protein S1 [Elusimicrobia bacterium]|nr:30S ribosomal protein S1 [Elusimicrobiota bacterium]